MENAAKRTETKDGGFRTPEESDRDEKDWEEITMAERARNSYLKLLRRMAPKRASRVRVPVKPATEAVRPGSAVTFIPPINDINVEVLETYTVVPDYAYVRISFNNATSEYMYEVIEPSMSQEEQELLDLIKDTLRRTLGYEWEKLTQLDKEEYLRESVDSFIRTRGVKVEKVTKKRI
ncbi:MAG TPA: hypothetical protein PKJ15_07640, partial [Methanomassiliicoccales archaeon]|nr:hypothetical protein [Methanomassiliicoccales archaeon]